MASSMPAPSCIIVVVRGALTNHVPGRRDLSSLRLGTSGPHEQRMGEVQGTSLHVIQDSRYAKQDGWELDDISLCSSGNIAVSGHNDDTDQTYVYIYGSTTTDDNSDSRDKPTLLFHKQFTDKPSWLPRYISFIKPNSTEIVTCRDDEVQVIDYNRDVVLRSRKVNGRTMCLSVSESQIFIGLGWSAIVNIYDNDLNRIKSIRLKGIRYDWPWDIAAAADMLYVCTYYGRAIVYSQDSRSILTEYTIGQDGRALSIAVNIQLQIVAVLWNEKQVAVYSISSNNCLVIFDVESGVSNVRIRISDKGRIVTGNEDTGEVKIYKLAQFFTFDNLKLTLSILLSESDQEELVKYFKISDDILKDDNDGIRDGEEKAARLLSILEKKGFLQDRNFHDLKQAFSHLGSCNTSMVMSHIDFYQKHTGKNASSDLQSSEDNESGQKLQLDGFLRDWSACDMSIDTCGNMVAVAGCCRNANKTSLAFVCKSDSDSQSPYIKTKEFEEVSNAERIVSFVDEYKVVTCCGNVIEIINCGTSKTEMKQTFQSSGSIVTCVSVRKGDVYVGFRNSAKILVLNRELQYKMTVTLNGVKHMWPVDLAAVSGKLLVCLKGYFISSQVILFKEGNGQKLVEYRNVEDGNKRPKSVAACEETDLVGILWSSHAHSDLALHSLTHGYCLYFVSDCYQGFGNRLRLTSQYAVMMDDRGGVKFLKVHHIISFDTWKTGFAHSFSSYEYEMLIAFYDLSNDEIIDNVDEEDNVITFKEMMKSAMEILTAKGYITSTNVTSLKNAFAGVGKLYADRLHQPLDAYIRYARETCITEIPVSVPSQPSDNIAEPLWQLQYSVQTQSNNAYTIFQQRNLSQSYPAQLPSQQPDIPSLPGPSNRSSVSGKRVLHESQQLNRERNGEHNGKRIRISDSGSQAISQAPMPPSTLQFSSLEPASVSTPSELLTPVTETQVSQRLAPVSTVPSSTEAQLPHPFYSASSVMSAVQGNQEESQNMFVQSMQQIQEVLSASSFGLPQPLETHHFGRFTEHYPANQVRQNEQLPSAQQVMNPRGHIGNHQVIVSQTSQSREQVVQPGMPEALAKSRNHIPKQVRSAMPIQPQVVNIEQNSQRCENSIQLNNAQQIVGNMQQQPLIPQNEMHNTRGRERTVSEVHIANESELNMQHTALPSNVVQQDLPDGEQQTGLEVTEYESIPASNYIVCEKMLAAANSPFQKYHANVLKDIHEKLGCLLSSSKSHHLQETPGTSLLSRCKNNVSGYSAEHEQEAITYLESLNEDDKSSLLAFKDMSDDREELVRRLVEKIFTGEERNNGNTSGTGNFQKLNEDKLQKIRSVVFYLCPIRTRKQFTDKLQDKEWKRLCEVIDTANRHYRQELKRQAKRKEKLPQS